MHTENLIPQLSKVPGQVISIPKHFGKSFREGITLDGGNTGGWQQGHASILCPQKSNTCISNNTNIREEITCLLPSWHGPTWNRHAKHGSSTSHTDISTPLASHVKNHNSYKRLIIITKGTLQFHIVSTFYNPALRPQLFLKPNESSPAAVSPIKHITSRTLSLQYLGTEMLQQNCIQKIHVHSPSLGCGHAMKGSDIFIKKRSHFIKRLFHP